MAVDPCDTSPIQNGIDGQGPGAGTKAKDRYVDDAQQNAPKMGDSRKDVASKTFEWSCMASDKDAERTATMGG